MAGTLSGPDDESTSGTAERQGTCVVQGEAASVAMLRKGHPPGKIRGSGMSDGWHLARHFVFSILFLYICKDLTIQPEEWVLACVYVCIF